MNAGIIAASRRRSGGGGGGPAPSAGSLVTLDFENGVYAMNEVLCTLADVVEENVAYGTYDPTDVVSGSGLVSTLTRGAPGGGVSGHTTPILTAAAYAAALVSGVNAGFTAVMSFSLFYGSSNQVYVGVELDESGFSAGWVSFLSWNGGEQSDLFDYGSIDSAVTLGSDGDHKIAFTLCSARLAASVDGNTVVSTAAPQANTGDAVLIYAGFNMANNATGTLTATIKKIEFFPTVANAGLPALSA
jgi:hypothetical protein